MLSVPAEVRTWDPPGPPMYTALVSRTVQSSDLFGPYREPTETQHSTAEYQQAVPPLGGKYWGEKLTEYGGIGGYPFHGQQRVRDLFVSRSHRHFGSGVTKAATYDQPSQVTDLTKSGCRMNDERLSAPMKTKLNTFPLQHVQWPGNHPYYAHKSIFEVFPEIKPKPETDSMSDGRTSYSTNTTNSYDDALRRLHHKLYHTTLYQQSYKGHFHDTPAAFQQELNAAAALEKARLDSISLPRKHEEKEMVKREESRLKDGNGDGYKDGREDEEEDEEEEEGKGENEKIEEEEEETTSQGGSSELRSILVSDSGKSANTSRPKSSKSQSSGAKRSVSFNDTPQVQILDTQDSERNRGGSEKRDGGIGTVGDSPSLQGTGPCWPPSTSLVIENIRGSQLLERRDITIAPPGPTSGQTSKGHIDPLKKFLSSSKIGEHYVPRPPLGPKAAMLPTIPLPSSLKSASSVITRLPSATNRGRHPFTGDAVHLPSGAEGLLHPGETTHLYARRENQPFVIPPSYRMQPMKPSGVLGSLPGLRPYSDPVRKLQDQLAKRIMIRKGDLATPLVLPPAPLLECLTPSGSKTPHRLGLRYKTEAHKRYHTLYPEETPDLRKARNSGRKCFFDGDHSSVFRG